MTRVQQAMAVGLAMWMVPVGLRAQATATTVLTIQNKTEAPLDVAAVSVDVDGKSEPLVGLVPLQPAQTQVAVLLDDSLRTSIGRQLSDIDDFVRGLPAGVQVLIGYMENGRVLSKGFTTNHEAAAAALRLPLSSPGVNASPYFALSDFAKNFPRETESYGEAPAQRGQPKARFVLLITNGVDPYNGSVSPLNQDSPYVTQSITDAQRAGLNVYSIYYGDVGIRGGFASFSGQGYLTQVADGTGGSLLYQLRGAPPSLSPYLKDFQQAIHDSELASFAVPGARDLVQVKFKTKEKGIKLRATRAVKASAE